MWIVYSDIDGMSLMTDDKEKALKEYEELKRHYKDSFDGEFSTDEQVVLAKVERNFYSADTGERVVEEDENGEEYLTKDTYWDWKEDIY